MSTPRTWTYVALAWLAATGCGNLTAGGFGETNVYLSGDEEEPAPAPSMAPISGPTPSSHIVAVGDVEVGFLAYLVTDEGQGFQIGSDEIFGEVPIDGSVEQLVKVQLTPEDRYTEVRLHFTNVTASVTSGLPVLGDVSVDIATTVIVSRPIDLNLDEDESADLVVDLNASQWLLTADPITHTVLESVFAAAVEVSLR